LLWKNDGTIGGGVRGGDFCLRGFDGMLKRANVTNYRVIAVEK